MHLVFRKLAEKTGFKTKLSTVFGMKLATFFIVVVMALAVSAHRHKRPPGSGSQEAYRRPRPPGPGSLEAYRRPRPPGPGSHEAYRRPRPPGSEEALGGPSPSLLQLLWLQYLTEYLVAAVPTFPSTPLVPMTTEATTATTTTTTTEPTTTSTDPQTTAGLLDLNTSAVFSINISNILSDIFGLSNRIYAEDTNE